MLGLKKIPIIGPAIAGISGITDEEIKESGYDKPLDRAAIGILEEIGEVADVVANAATATLGTGWDNDIDLSKDIRDAFLEDGWFKDLMQMNTSGLKERVFGPVTVPEWDPAKMFTRSETRHMIRGVNGADPTNGAIIPGSVDPSVAWRFSDEQLAAINRIANAVERNAQEAEKTRRLIEDQQ
jgi:hypothetical protein